RDIHLAGLAEPLGFDTVSGVEHHFFNYAMAPDNMQFLSYMAAITKKIGLLTGAVILPWHNPLRVVEKMILLDHLSKGRAIFGIGRGLEKGIVEGHGKHYPQKRTEVRPRPYASFKDRFYCVAMSSDSVPVCARLGA